MPWSSRSTSTLLSRPGRATSPSVWGNESRTTTTPTTRAATSSRATTPTPYVDQRLHRGQERNPPDGADVAPRLLAAEGVSDTADIVPGGGSSLATATERPGKFAKGGGVEILGSRTPGVPTRRGS